MRLAGVVLLGGLLALAAGCAHDFVYLPVGAGTSGGPAAQYPVPPQNPQGEVYVTSFGFADLEDGPPGVPLLHARLAVSNGSSSTWTVNAGDQRLLAPGQPARGPTFVNTDAGGAGPTYQVQPGRANVFDLYFSVSPAGDRRAPANDLDSYALDSYALDSYAPGSYALTSFSLDWSVNAGGQMVADATSFQRFVEEADEAYDDYPDYVSVGLDFGVGWWGAPLFFPYGRYPPHVHGYYDWPHHVYGGGWQGPRPGGWHAAPPGGGWAHGGFHGGGFHGGGFHGGGFHGGGAHGGGHR
ncbi:MAG TPA: hypothetical protein VKZ18_22265 [Polyangia bacterium]|nr:hypothetical protein [Polyangia bacterium]